MPWELALLAKLQSCTVYLILRTIPVYLHLLVFYNRDVVGIGSFIKIIGLWGFQTRVQASTLTFPEIISKLPQIGARGLYRGSIPAILGQFSRLS